MERERKMKLAKILATGIVGLGALGLVGCSDYQKTYRVESNLPRTSYGSPTWKAELITDQIQRKTLSVIITGSVYELCDINIIENVYVTNREGEIIYTIIENKNVNESFQGRIGHNFSPLNTDELLEKHGMAIHHRRSGTRLRPGYFCLNYLPKLKVEENYYLIVNDVFGNITIDGEEERIGFIGEETKEKILSKLKEQGKLKN